MEVLIYSVVKGKKNKFDSCFWRRTLLNSYKVDLLESSSITSSMVKDDIIPNLDVSDKLLADLTTNALAALNNTFLTVNQSDFLKCKSDHVTLHVIILQFLLIVSRMKRKTL